MSHSRSLLTLLDSVDPDVRAQGVELARSMGADAIDAILSDLPLTKDGLLWHPRGLSAELLTLLLSAGAAVRARIRRLVLSGAISEALLADLSRLPSLTALTLARVPAVDPQLLRSFSGLRRLSVVGMEVDVAVLCGLPALRHLSLQDCTVYDLAPLTAMPLMSLSLQQLRGSSDHDPLPLPTTLSALDLRGRPAPISNFGRLALRTLAIDAAEVNGRIWAARISELTITRCRDLSRLRGLSVTHLGLDDLHDSDDEAVVDWPRLDLSALAGLTSLRSIRLPRTIARQPPVGLAALLLLPALQVVELDDEQGWPFEFSDRWVGTPALLRRALNAPRYLATHHPIQRPAVQARTAAHWHQRGHRYQLRALQPIDGKINAIRRLRAHVRLRLKDCKEIMDGLMGAGTSGPERRDLDHHTFSCLTLPQAVQLQGWLQRAGFAVEITPWTPPVPR